MLLQRSQGVDPSSAFFKREIRLDSLELSRIAPYANESEGGKNGVRIATPPLPLQRDSRGRALVTMGGTNKTILPKYPDVTNYTLWIQLGGRSFDTAWEYHTQRAIAAAIE